MKKKNSRLILVVLILLIIFATMMYFLLKPTSNNLKNLASSIREITVGTGTIEKTITGSRRNFNWSDRKIRIRHI